MTRDKDKGRTMQDLVVCIQNFGLYPKNFGKPLQIFQTGGVCICVKFERFTLPYSVYVKLVNSVREEVCDWSGGTVDVGKQSC